MESPDDFMAKYRSDMEAARAQTEYDQLQVQLGKEQFEKFSNAVFSVSNAIWRVPQNLQRNIYIGLGKAALHTVDTIDDGFAAGAEMVIGAVEGDDKGSSLQPVPPLRTLFPEVFESAEAMLAEAEKDDRMTDDLVQGLVQFTVPFAGYMRGFAGLDKLGKLGTAGKIGLAEGVTAATAFDAHEGRMADLVAMGWQSEKDFATLMTNVDPEGSLFNQYLNWMTDRENESEWEGRWKNAVDSVASTAAVAGLIKAAGVTLRSTAKQIPSMSLDRNTKFRSPEPETPAPKEAE